MEKFQALLVKSSGAIGIIPMLGYFGQVRERGRHTPLVTELAKERHALAAQDFYSLKIVLAARDDTQVV